jgi:hypothetical protein
MNLPAHITPNEIRPIEKALCDLVEKYSQMHPTKPERAELGKMIRQLAAEFTRQKTAH